VVPGTVVAPITYNCYLLMLSFLTPLLGFLGGPVITGVISAYKAKLEAGNTTDRIAADLAARELTVQQAEVQAQNNLR